LGTVDSKEPDVRGRRLFYISVFMTYSGATEARDKVVFLIGKCRKELRLWDGVRDAFVRSEL
jgi:hypothetical protein